MEPQETPDYGDGAYRDEWADPKFKRYVSILHRHGWAVLATFVVVATVGIIRAHKAVPVYGATARILVERQLPRVTSFEDVMQPSVGWWGQEYYKTQVELVRSRAVLEIALENPDIHAMFETADTEPVRLSWRQRFRMTLAGLLGIPPPVPAEPWERLRGAIDSKHINDTHFVAVIAESGDRHRAAKVANAVADAFVKYHLLRRLVVSRDVFLYLQEQKQKEEAELRSAENTLQEFRESTQISSLDSSDNDHPVLRRLSVLNSELTERQLDRIEIETQYRVVREALDKGTEGLTAINEQLFSLPAVREDQTISEIRSAMVMAEQAKAELTDLYGPEHPRMQTAQTKLELLRTKLSESLANVASALATRLMMLEEQERELTQENEEQNQLALDLARQSITYQHLVNEVERHRRLFQVLVERMSEVELSADYGKTNVEVVESASVPASPSRPNKMRMAMFSLLLAVLAGLGVGFLLEHLDDTVRTPEDLEIRVGIPVLGFVPEILVKKRLDNKESYRALVSVMEPEGSSVEAYRNIRTNLLFSSPSREYKAIIITSGGPGDGKTTTACNLAISLAQSKKRVLLVDGDLRRPQLHKIFGLDSSVGLSSVLVGEASVDQALQKTVHDLEIIENLDILAAGPRPPNPTELLESNSMRRLVAEMRERYDWIVIDSPPVLFASDTSVMSTITDGVILVVKSAKRTWAHATRALRQIQKVNGRVIGGILNNVRVSAIGHYYSDYFYHGYARYRSDYYSAYYSTDAQGRRTRTRKHAKV